MTEDISAGSLAQQPALASHYKAIGPAAIVAALPHTAKKKPAQKTITPRAGENNRTFRTPVVRWETVKFTTTNGRVTAAGTR